MNLAMFYYVGRWLQGYTKWATEQVYYVRKAIHMELVVQYKHQNVLVYQSRTMAKVFWGHN